MVLKRDTIYTLIGGLTFIVVKLIIQCILLLWNQVGQTMGNLYLKVI